MAEYTIRFVTTAASRGVPYRKLDSRLELNYIFSLRCERTVGKDHVIDAIPGAAMQRAAFASYHGNAEGKVEVCHQPASDFHIYMNRRLLLEYIRPVASFAHQPRSGKCLQERW